MTFYRQSTQAGATWLDQGDSRNFLNWAIIFW